MERTRAAERDQRTLSGIMPLLDGDAANGISHVAVDDGDDALGSLLAAQTQAPGKTVNSHAGQLGIDRHLAAQEVLWIQPAKEQMGVRHRRLGAAAAVARGTRPRARAPGADPEGAACVDISDAATARANGLDVDHWHHDRVAADPGVAGAVLHEAALGDDADAGAGTTV